MNKTARFLLALAGIAFLALAFWGWRLGAGGLFPLGLSFC